MDIKKQAFTFDDVSLVPQFTEAERGDIDISSNLCGWEMDVPVISSPMDTITGIKMMEVLRAFPGFHRGVRGLGIHHRYCEISDISEARDFGGIAVSPSMSLSVLEGLISPWNPNPLMCLDVAHGHTKRNLDLAHELVKMGADVISGNIVTEEAAEAYLKVGVQALRVGIGAGSACTTRVVTGVGIPQLTAIQNIWDAVGNDAISYRMADIEPQAIL